MSVGDPAPLDRIAGSRAAAENGNARLTPGDGACTSDELFLSRPLQRRPEFRPSTARLFIIITIIIRRIWVEVVKCILGALLEGIFGGFPHVVNERIAVLVVSNERRLGLRLAKGSFAAKLFAKLQCRNPIAQWLDFAPALDRRVQVSFPATSTYSAPFRWLNLIRSPVFFS
jgi:hypothetical protein